jgi:hypothetical protein
VKGGDGAETAEYADHAVPFFLSGSQASTATSELPCPAWLVPRAAAGNVPVLTFQNSEAITCNCRGMDVPAEQALRYRRPCLTVNPQWLAKTEKYSDLLTFSSEADAWMLLLTRGPLPGEPEEKVKIPRGGKKASSSQKNVVVEEEKSAQMSIMSHIGAAAAIQSFGVAVQKKTKGHKDQGGAASLNKSCRHLIK